MATTTTHTPGPWTVGPSPNRLDIDLLIRSPGGGIVAKVFVRGDSGAAGEANARLMPAAPDLSDTLEEIADRLDVGGEQSREFAEEIELARGAVLKAHGGAA